MIRVALTNRSGDLAGKAVLASGLLSRQATRPHNGRNRLAAAEDVVTKWPTVRS